jgi:hypothetical protein
VPPCPAHINYILEMFQDDEKRDGHEQLFTIAKYREAFGFDAVFFIEQTEVDVL